MSFLRVTNYFKIRFIFRLVSKSFLLSISDLKFRRPGLPNRHFRMESIAKIDFSWKSFLMNSGMDVCRLFDALGAVFLIFEALKTRLKTKRFLVKSRILIIGFGGASRGGIWAL